MVSPGFSSDVAVAKSALADLPVNWDGKAAVLALKGANGRWRDMEWFGFYFEYLCELRLQGQFTIPGERFGTTTFDLKRSVNWDLKSSAIKPGPHRVILNDKSAMQQSVRENGEHGFIMALCDVEYNDASRSFQRWHTELKGGLSAYEQERIARTVASRNRKTRAQLVELLFLRIDGDTINSLETHRQGRNSNGQPRPEKYKINLRRADAFLVDRLVF